MGLNICEEQMNMSWFTLNLSSVSVQLGQIEKAEIEMWMARVKEGAFSEKEADVV